MMFSIIALEFFKLQPEQNGYLMAYFGIVQMVNCTVVQLTHVAFLVLHRYDSTICSGRSGSRDRSDDRKVLRELAAASVCRGLCFGGTGSGTRTHVQAHLYMHEQAYT